MQPLFTASPVGHTRNGPRLTAVFGSDGGEGHVDHRGTEKPGEGPGPPAISAVRLAHPLAEPASTRLNCRERFTTRSSSM
jgi:hypothetical protein